MDYYSSMCKKYIHLMDETDCYKTGCKEDAVYLHVRLSNNDVFQWASGECARHRNEGCPDECDCGCPNFIVSKRDGKNINIWHSEGEEPVTFYEEI